MNSHNQLFVLLTISLCFFVACGPTLENPGIDKNKKLSELNDEEVNTLKTLSEEAMDVNSVCAMSAALATAGEGSTSKEKCEEYTKTCLESSENRLTAPATTQSKEQFAKCSDSATVETLTKCQILLTTAYKELTSQYNCDSIPSDPSSAQSSLLGIFATISTGSCKQLQEACAPSRTAEPTPPRTSP